MMRMRIEPTAGGTPQSFFKVQLKSTKKMYFIVTNSNILPQFKFR